MLDEYKPETYSEVKQINDKIYYTKVRHGKLASISLPFSTSMYILTDVRLYYL